MPHPPSWQQVRRRRLAALALLVAVVAAAIAVIAADRGDEPKRLVPGGGEGAGEYDPLAYDEDREEELRRRAAAGFSDVIYEKSPGGVIATANRTARWRATIDQAARANGVDPATLEAIVFLESAGRPDVVAGGDLEGAVGLTQILASTATDLLGMRVDLARSRDLTKRIAAAPTLTEVRRLERARRRADQRFDPPRSIAAAARYLALGEKEFGRPDLSVATYHMGMGNLKNILARYEGQGGDEDSSYTRLYFDLAPQRKPRAYALLSSLGDDSSNYLWRVLAAKEIMRLARNDRPKLRRLAALENEGGAGARRLFPQGPPEESTSARRAPDYGPAIGLRFTGAAKREFAPDPATLSALLYIGAGTRAISGQRPLTVTGAHGVRIEVSRRYKSERQALAFQFMLDRLQAWNLIAWARGGRTLAIVVAPEAAKLLPPPKKLLSDVRR